MTEPTPLLDVGASALVLVDLQAGITDGSLGDVLPHGADTVVANGARLAAAFRAAGRPVIHVRVDYGSNFELAVQVPHDWNVEYRPAPGWDAPDERVGEQPGDIVVIKHSYSGFHATDLDVQLRRRGIRTIVVGGIATNQGVEATVRAGHDHGYAQVIVSDAMGAFVEVQHTYPIEQIFPLLGKVADTDSVIDALAAGG